MMNRNLLLITREAWYLMSDTEIREVPAWSRIDSPTLVVTDFDDAPVDVHRFEGKLAHAGALVEKHARTTGLSEGETHIVLHRVTATPGGGVAFYTAVPLDQWQRMQHWTAQQNDHCLLVVLAGLLEQGLSQGQARVLRLGSAVHLLGLNDTGIFHASVTVMGDGEDNLNTALRALATKARDGLAGGVDKPVQWACGLADDLQAEARYASVFAESARIECQQLTHTQWSLHNASHKFSALPELCDNLKASAIQVSLARRLAWLSETLVAPLAAVSAVVGLGFFVMGTVMQYQANEKNQRVRERATQAQALEARINAANQIEVSSHLKSGGAFVSRLAQGAVFDPVAMLQLVRQASPQDLRILRIKLDVESDKKKFFRIDGVSENAGSQALGRFLAQTQAAGWKAEALDPSVQASGAFSYRLTPLIAPPV
jgi:hypothetical protein